MEGSGKVAGKREGEPPSAWVTLMLHDFVDVCRMEAGILRDIHSTMGMGVECFVPVQTHSIASREFKVSLFDGYCFVRHDGTREFESRVRKVRGGYIQGCLFSNGKLSYVTGREINKYREQLRERAYSYMPDVGDLVEGVEGIFTAMLGVILSVDRVAKTADVLFKTKTREVTAKNLSFIALKLRDENYYH